MHRFLSGSAESADLTERNTGGAQRTPIDFGAAVENLCIIRARDSEVKEVARRD